MNSLAIDLLTWYSEQRRDLPWRRIEDPYAIMVSEIMLQQTQVRTVIPYYTKWLEKFPSFQAVANAEINDLLKAWEGLGYYARCRNFQTACQIIMEKHHGTLPQDYKEFRALPGVGEYTANMVLSIIADYPRLAMDGNIARIGARILRIITLTPYNRRRIENYFNAIIMAFKPGSINQALMDIGSEICTPRQPSCEACPLNPVCLGQKTGMPDRYPGKPAAIKKPLRYLGAGMIWDSDKFLIRQRPPNGLLGGMWELPYQSLQTHNSGLSTLMEGFKEEYGFQLSNPEPIGTIRHSYSHFSISLALYYFYLDPPKTMNANHNHRWIHRTQIPDYAFSKSNHKLFALINEKGWKSHG